jgi:hypothetical protein
MRFTRLHALPATLALVTLLPACQDDSAADPTGETADARTPDAFVGDAHQDTWDAVVDAARPDTAPLPDASTDAAPPTPDAAPPPAATLGAGRFRLEVRAAPFGLTLTRDGAPVAQVRRIDAAFAETREEAFDRSKYYDPAKPATLPRDLGDAVARGRARRGRRAHRLAAGDWQAAFTLGTGRGGPLHRRGRARRPRPPGATAPGAGRARGRGLLRPRRAVRHTRAPRQTPSDADRPGHPQRGVLLRVSRSRAAAHRHGGLGSVRRGSPPPRTSTSRPRIRNTSRWSSKRND